MMLTQADIVKDLRKLANDLKPSKKGNNVPLSQVVFPINEIVNRLRDMHVDIYNSGVDLAYGGIHAGHRLYLFDTGAYASSPIAPPESTITPLGLGVFKSKGRLVLRDQDFGCDSLPVCKGKSVTSICGLAPMKWLRSVSNLDVFGDTNHKVC